MTGSSKQLFANSTGTGLRNGDYSTFEWPKIRKMIIIMTIVGALMVFAVHEWIKFGVIDEYRAKQAPIDAMNARIDEFNALSLEERVIVAKYEHYTVDDDYLMARIPDAQIWEYGLGWKYLVYRLLFALYSLVIISDYTLACAGKYFICDLPRDHRTVIFFITTLGLWPIWLISYVNMQRFLRRNPHAGDL